MTISIWIPPREFIVDINRQFTMDKGFYVPGGNLRSPGSLDHHLEIIQKKVMGRDLFPTIYDKTAHLGYSIISGHPFIDGNKRTGMYISLFTLNVNDYQTSVQKVSNEEVVEISLEVENNDKSESEFSCWLQDKVISTPT
ncbi:MAG: type II toxin-antitoxin system death-on-curing family toxin [Candidatus Acetothermia bacterium]